MSHCLAWRCSLSLLYFSRILFIFIISFFVIFISEKNLNNFIAGMLKNIASLLYIGFRVHMTNQYDNNSLFGQDTWFLLCSKNSLFNHYLSLGDILGGTQSEIL